MDTKYKIDIKYRIVSQIPLTPLTRLFENFEAEIDS